MASPRQIRLLKEFRGTRFVPGHVYDIGSTDGIDAVTAHALVDAGKAEYLANTGETTELPETKQEAKADQAELAGPASVEGAEERTKEAAPEGLAPPATMDRTAAANERQAARRPGGRPRGSGKKGE